jgi:mono/diheme cytochrome c family protein
LTAIPASGSSFAGWGGDCSGIVTTCTVSASAARSVRADFGLSTPIPEISATSFTPPERLRDYLNANPQVNTAARFIAALPAVFRQNWLMMTRSESLQTGTAQSPRFMLTSANAEQVFTFGLATSDAYPGSHPNAIEYMQWDEAQKTFRFHEVIVAPIPALNGGIELFAARPRGVAIDDVKCSRCHTTRNVISNGGIGTSIGPEVVKAKSKPNWDSYDSWAGMLPFNRDRIYQGSVEAAAFRRLLNPWGQTVPGMQAFIEQLTLQPPNVLPQDVITREVGGANDAQIRFAFDPPGPIATSEPAPAGDEKLAIGYNLEGGTTTPDEVQRQGKFVTLRHSTDVSDIGEGRGVQLFDLLGGGDGTLNQKRIGDELANHRFATGSVAIDARPIALAINSDCVGISEAQRAIGVGAPLTVDLNFFDARNGMNLDALLSDTGQRAKSAPKRKVDLQRFNLNRTGDIYFPGLVEGIIQRYGNATSFGTSVSLSRMRQEIFRRRQDAGSPDATVMGGVFVDREDYGNTRPVALYRYFLEPLGVSVDKWSMGVRGRSRTYAFADVFGPTYKQPIGDALRESLTLDPFPGLAPANLRNCVELIGAVNRSLGALPGAEDVPTYTDIQRIFNKACVECHGGLNYPPVAQSFPSEYLNLSESEAAPGTSRMRRSYEAVQAVLGQEVSSSRLYDRITRTSEQCTGGMMPCGGPALSKTDVETVRRWIVGGAAYTEGDPHITTVDGVRYDFQSAGEFVLLRDDLLEVQARQVPVETAVPLAPNEHSGLSSCVSVTGAVAVRVGSQRITYQPDPLGGLIDWNLLDEFGLDELGILDFGLSALNWLFGPDSPQLRVDGRVVSVNGPVSLSGGARIVPTDTPGGIKIEVPGGTEVFITPGFWSYYQMWYLNLDVRHTRATQGVMGAVAPNNWLPALPNGAQLGPRPSDLHQRHVDLYERFADAWRVRSNESLFDYAFGTSTTTYTLRSWPGENPTTCRVPAGTPGKPTKPPAQPIPLATARLHCQGIADVARRTNCEQDVAVTGNGGFASTYTATERIDSNQPPNRPQLISPENDKTGLSFKLTFSWNKVIDPEGSKVTYLHCLWPTDEKFSYKRCTAVSPSLLNPFATTMTTTYLELACPRNYYWKVIAQDEQGATRESETRRFATK